jgi:hypothetical protein
VRRVDRRPERDPSADPLETIGTLRNLEREARLAMTEAGGGVVIGVADPDEPASASS